MRGIRIAVSAAVLGLAAASAQAASPGAWAELYAKSSAACLKASGLSSPKVRGETADFQGAVLLIIDGRHPNGMRGTAYCLYDKVTAKAETTPAQVDPAQLEQVAAAPKPKQATGRICWTEGYGAPMKTARPIGAPCRAVDSDGESYFGTVRR